MRRDQPADRNGIKPAKTRGKILPEILSDTCTEFEQMIPVQYHLAIIYSWNDFA